MAPFKLTIAENRKRVVQVFEILKESYPEATCSLDHVDPLQLLISTILAAQCTDVRVNIVTPVLFERFPAPQDYLEAKPGEIEEIIHSCGFYRQKARSIRKVCAAVLENFGGQVPNTMDELLTLNGVGRKTANVLLGQWFGKPAIIVDTHCTRLNRRLGFTKQEDPAKIERDLMKILPDKMWTHYSHCMVFHGRAVCTARRPSCSACTAREFCPFPQTREGKKIAS